jgi:TetR/AcrR family transcriptional regulator, cholesterol catabolism regulator
MSETGPNPESAIRRPVARVGDSALVERRREQIVEAAAKLVSRQGFAKTVIRDIAHEANLSVGLVYEYVRAKEDILFLIFEHGMSQWHQALTEALSGDIGPLERLRNAISRLVTLADEDRDQVHLWYRESGNLNPDGKAMVKEGERMLVGLLSATIAEAQHEGLLRDSFDPSELATMLILNVHGWVLKGYLLRDHGPREAFASWLTDGYLLGFASDQEHTVPSDSAATPRRVRAAR